MGNQIASSHHMKATQKAWHLRSAEDNRVYNGTFDTGICLDVGNISIGIIFIECSFQIAPVCLI